MVLVDKVTAPADSARPVTNAFAPIVIAPVARIVPLKIEVAPVPTAPVDCQNTF